MRSLLIIALVLLSGFCSKSSWAQWVQDESKNPIGSVMLVPQIIASPQTIEFVDVNAYLPKNVAPELSVAECGNTAIRTEKQLEFLGRSVDLIECSVQIGREDRYSIEGCQKYKSCYNSRKFKSQKTEKEIREEFAIKHTKMLLRKESHWLKEFSEYDSLKVFIENDMEKAKSYKLCPSKLEIKETDKCDVKLMSSIISQEERESYKKQQRNIKRFKDFRYAMQVNTAFTPEALVKMYKGSSSQNEYDPMLEYFEIKDGPKVKVNPYFEEFLKTLNKEKNSSKRLALFDKYIEEKNHENVDGNCEDSKLYGNGKFGGSLQNMCEFATALARGEVRRYPVTPFEVSSLYADEMMDDLDLSYQRCLSLGVINVSATRLIESLYEPSVPTSNTQTSATGNTTPYGSRDAFVGPIPQVTSPSTQSATSTADKSDIATKNVDEFTGEVAATEKAPASTAKSPVQDSNSTNYSNAYTGVDYGIPGTHPMATDQSGLPIPSPSYPSYINGAQTPQQQGQVSAASSDVNAIQTKLDETQAKLDKLTAEVAATKAEAEKKKNQDEIDGLKKEIEKLKAEKASAVLASTQPAAPIASPPPPINAPAMTAVAPTRQEEYRSAPAAVPTSKISSASKAASLASGTGVASTGSGALLLRQDIVDMPMVDLTNTSSEDPSILKLAMNSVGGKAFPVQDKNKIIWTIVPLIKDGKVVSYTAIREKKVAEKKEKKTEVARVPASVNTAPVETAKREIFLKDLNGLIKGKN